MPSNKNYPTRCDAAGCQELSLALSQFCWDHLPEKSSYAETVAEAIKNGHDLSGCNLKKAVLVKAVLEKPNFSGANLSQADLSGAQLFDAKLDGAEMLGVNLADSDLTHCSLKGADLTKANLAGARLWNASLAGANLTECDLSGADLWNANLYNVKLWHTLFSGAKSMTMMTFSKGTKLLDNPRINEAGALSAEESYRDIKQYFLTSGMYKDASWASFKEKTMERLVLKNKGDLRYFPSLLMDVLCGYGEKTSRIVLTAILAILTYALLYFSFNAVEKATDPRYIMKWYDYIYYSTITFTTVGYGDFIPRSCGLFRLLAACEAFSGVFVTGLFVFTLARKYSAR
jgi:uncharacterized protein YjbI with pentapeptide repeats